jgi:hypothetical protein
MTESKHCSWNQGSLNKPLFSFMEINPSVLMRASCGGTEGCMQPTKIWEKARQGGRVRRAEERETERGREGYLYEERDEGLNICSSTRALPIT